MRSWPDSWTPATEICRYKYGIVTSSTSSSPSSSSPNYYTSAIARALACGNLPLLVGGKLTPGSGSSSSPSSGEAIPDAGAHAPYYARWLRQNYHYLHVRAAKEASTDSSSSTRAGAGAKLPTSPDFSLMCSDLSRAISWARSHRADASAIASAARRFATNVLGPRIVHEYLLTVLSEVSTWKQ